MGDFWGFFVGFLGFFECFGVGRPERNPKKVTLTYLGTHPHVYIHKNEHSVECGESGKSGEEEEKEEGRNRGEN